MKDIKDYLHLYLGANVEVKKKNDKNFLIGRISEVTRASNHGDWIKVQFEDCYTITDDNWNQSTSNAHYFFMNWDSIKLILRPLSDMTEEEAKEFCIKEGWGENLSNIVVTDSSIEFKVGQHQQAVQRFTRCRPEIFHWLLSKQFDLFGLIEAGLAIDKTKL